MPKKGPLYPHIPKRRQARVIPTEPGRPRGGKELEFLSDSPEVLAQTVAATGYRGKLDSAFKEAINRVKGRK